MATGRPLPPKIANAPELAIGLELYYDAFLDLNTCRPMSMGIGPIPWTSMKDYAIAYGLDAEQTDDLMNHVRALDHAYMEHFHKKAEGNRSTKGKK